jgi:hypothetical protein
MIILFINKRYTNKLSRKSKKNTIKLKKKIDYILIILQTIICICKSFLTKMCDNLSPELIAFFNTMDSNIHRSHQQDKNKIDSLKKKIIMIMYNDIFSTDMKLIKERIDTMTKSNAKYCDYEEFYRRLKTSVLTNQKVVLD